MVVIIAHMLATPAKDIRDMATNPPAGDGRRYGAVRERSQVFNPKTETWTKRNTGNGRFVGTKKDGTPFKCVRKER